MVRVGEIEHGSRIADRAESIWNWASPAGRQRARRRASLIIQAARLSSQTVALELGCGTGLFTRSFCETGSRIVAVDVSHALLERARKRPWRQSVAFRLEDAEALSFEDESFDALIGSSVLHHVELGRALPEAYRTLKPGGRFAFAEPNMMNPQIALQRTVPILRRWAGESPHETAFFRWRLAHRLREAGFIQVRIVPFDFLHPVVPEPMIDAVQRLGRVLEQVPLMREIAGSLLISAVRGPAEHTRSQAQTACL